MLPLRPRLAATLLLFAFSLAACQADGHTTAPASNPSPTLTPTSTLSLPTHTPNTLTPTLTLAATPTDSTSRDFSHLESKLSPGVDWYILIEDANTAETLFERSATTPFPPASMIKIPTAMAVLSILEDQGRTLDDMKSIGINGRNFDSLLEAMVVHSEESAADTLEYFARGDNQLRKKLDGWGLIHTKYDPRTSTVSELLTSLRLLNTGAALNQENTRFLLDLMAVYTENDQILLGKLTQELPGCDFLNKRGTMLSPTIVSDMGILRCGDRSWYLLIAGIPARDSTATF